LDLLQKQFKKNLLGGSYPGTKFTFYEPLPKLSIQKNTGCLTCAVALHLLRDFCCV